MLENLVRVVITLIAGAAATIIGLGALWFIKGFIDPDDRWTHWLEMAGYCLLLAYVFYWIGTKVLALIAAL